MCGFQTEKVLPFVLHLVQYMLNESYEFCKIAKYILSIYMVYYICTIKRGKLRII